LYWTVLIDVNDTDNGRQTEEIFFFAKNYFLSMRAMCAASQIKPKPSKLHLIISEKFLVTSKHNRPWFTHEITLEDL
jgi:hypothetical protein